MVAVTGFKNLMQGERGAVHLEYALLATLIAVAAVAAVTAFGLSVFDLYDGFPLSIFQ